MGNIGDTLDVVAKRNMSLGRGDAGVYHARLALAKPWNGFYFFFVPKNGNWDILDLGSLNILYGSEEAARDLRSTLYNSPEHFVVTFIGILPADVILYRQRNLVSQSTYKTEDGLVFKYLDIYDCNWVRGRDAPSVEINGVEYPMGSPEFNSIFDGRKLERIETDAHKEM